MKILKIARNLGLLVITGLLFACGSGGGGGDDTSIFNLKLRTVGEGTIGSVNTIDVTLPAGVSVYPAATGVTASGNAAGSLVEFKTTGQTTTISLAKADGFAAGEFLTVACGYSGKVAPTLDAITISYPETYKIADLQGNDITSSFTIEKFTTAP